MLLGRTARFRRQHEDLARTSASLSKLLSLRQLEEDPQRIRLLVAKLSGAVAMHSAMENEALYPELLASPDEDVRARAQRLFDEVKSVYADIAAFATRWPNVERIQTDPAGFLRETHHALAILGRRIAREHLELYPLIDAADAEPRGTK